MNNQIMRQLQKITPEERRIIQGDKTIQQEIYTSAKDFTVDSEKMLKKGKLIDIRPHTRFIAFPKHKHNYVEIIYMCSGQTTHLINDSIPLVLQEGELLFLNQHAVHSVKKAEEKDIAVNFIILPEFFDVAFHMLDQDNVLSNFLISSLRQDRDEISYLHYKVAGVLPIQNLVENMIWSLLNKQSNHRQIDQFTMGLLFLQLLNYTDRLEVEKPQHHNSPLVIAALRQIEESYKYANLTEIAKDNKVSVAYLSKAIKQSTGKTYKELLQQKRLNKAVELLERSRLSVLDIAVAVGYDNTSYFYRIFRKNYKMSPKEFRKSIRQTVK